MKQSPDLTPFALRPYLAWPLFPLHRPQPYVPFCDALPDAGAPAWVKVGEAWRGGSLQLLALID